MGKYSNMYDDEQGWHLEILIRIANELAEANRLKRIEIQCLKAPIKLAEKLSEQIDDRA